MPPIRSVRRSARLATRQRDKRLAYRPLGDREIRLVILLPGAFSSGIQCQLTHHKFEDASKYDALSYVWGDPALTSTISLDGCDFTVTAELECALRYLRLLHTSRILWIDAICINQGDDTERNHQVQLMFDIYQNAETVRAWIGRETEPGDQTFRDQIEALMRVSRPRDEISHLQTLYDYFDKEWDALKFVDAFGRAPRPSSQERRSLPSTKYKCFSIAKLFEGSSGVRAFYDLSVIGSRPYWRRVWIQQEVVRTSQVTVHIRKSSFSLSSIYDLCDALKRSTREKRPRNPLWVYIQGLLTHVYLLSVYKNSSAAMSAHHLSGLLQAQFFKYTTDPRDKIYGLVGLIPEWRDGGLPVNYRLSVRHVYAAAVKFMAKHFNSLRLLACQFIIPKESSLPELPSWCPDWSKTFHTYGDVMAASAFPLANTRIPKCRFSADRGGQPEILFANDDQTLIANGVSLDAIMGEVYHAANLAKRYGCGSYSLNWRHYDRDMALSHEKYSSTVNLGENKDTVNFSKEQADAHRKDWVGAFWRTLVADSAEPKDFAYELFETADLQPQWRECATPRKGNSSQAINSQLSKVQGAELEYPYKSVLDDMFVACRKRRFFISNNKHMGLAPAEAQEGDLICVLFGCLLGYPLLSP